MAETKKILDPKIRLTATCVRVPVFISHSESVNVEFEKPITADEARDLGRRGMSVQAELLRFVQDARLEKGAPDARARILVDVDKEQLRLFGKKHAFGVNVRLAGLVRQGRLRRSVLRLRQRQPPGRSRDARAS